MPYKVGSPLTVWIDGDWSSTKRNVKSTTVSDGASVLSRNHEFLVMGSSRHVYTKASCGHNQFCRMQAEDIFQIVLFISRKFTDNPVKRSQISLEPGGQAC